MMTPDFSSRIFGGLYGSLVGDALGVSVEFRPRSILASDPVVDMRGHGTHGQPKGTWSDDGSLLLCSVESLVERGFDTEDMGRRFLRWFERGYWAAHGVVFDIGIATQKALNRISQGVPAEQAGGTDLYDNGNGSLMRILPVALANLRAETAEFADRIQRASCITHGHPRSQMACVFHGLFARALVEGMDPPRALQSAQAHFVRLFESSEELSHFHHVLSADFAQSTEHEIRSGGYVMDTLAASIWCVLNSSNFAECALKAVNLGEDTDTTGCVAGGLAGLLYGVDAIPQDWLESLPRQGELIGLFTAFGQAIHPGE